MGIEVSTVVEFGVGAEDSSEYIFNVDLDEETNGGKTSFTIGEAVTFKVNHSSNVEILRVISTDGGIRQTATAVSRVQTDEVLFANDTLDDPTVYRLSVIPISSIISYMGRGGALTRRVPFANVVEYIGDYTKVPFRAKFISNFQCKLFTLSSPSITLGSDETYTIDVVFYIRVNL